MVPASFIMWAHSFIESQVEISEWNAKEAKRGQIKKGNTNLRFEHESEEHEGQILMNHGVQPNLPPE